MPKTRSPNSVPEGGSDGATTDISAAIRKHSVKLSGHSTSLSLEGVYWDALRDVAAEMGLSMNRLIERIDRERSGNLSSAVRIFLFQHYRSRAQQVGGDEAVQPAPDGPVDLSA